MGGIGGIFGGDLIFFDSELFCSPVFLSQYIPKLKNAICRFLPPRAPASRRAIGALFVQQQPGKSVFGGKIDKLPHDF